MNKREITATLAIDIEAKASQLENVLKGLKGELKNFDLTDSMTNGLNETFSQIEKSLDKIRDKTTGNKLELIDKNEAVKTAKELDHLYEILINKLESTGLSSAKLKEDKAALNELAKASANYERAVKSTVTQEEKLARAIADADTKLKAAQQSKAEDIKNNKGQQQSIQDEIKTLNEQKTAREADWKAREKIINEAKKKAEDEAKLNGTEVNYKSIPGATKPQATSEYRDLKKVTDQIKEKEKALKDLQEAEKELESNDALEKALEKAKKEFQEFEIIANQRKSDAFAEVKKALTDQTVVDFSKFDIDISQIQNFEQLQNAIKGLSGDAATRAQEALNAIIKACKEGKDPVDALKNAINGGSDAIHELSDTQKEIDSLKGKLKSFFSLTNSINLFKRAVRSAYQTIKELDAAMTEMAVVTDLDISDYWKQLPQYTARAKELGLTIKDVYESMTLFYQQGLNTEEATALSNATLKMARIAGLDAAEATDRMTNALRGFNMELNETSATNVADVYSKLAAITASDVDEISTAMTKVASIANSAGMSFENTAAFLSQIIN